MLKFIKGLCICGAGFFAFLIIVAISGHMLIEHVLPGIVAIFE